MDKKSKYSSEIKEFILRNVEDYPATIVTIAMKKFDYSRTAILRYIQVLAEANLLAYSGNTYARRYKLLPIVKIEFEKKIDYLWGEDQVWREDILPLLEGQKKNIIGICEYGFTEMLNNVLDHATSPIVSIFYCQTYSQITMRITDKGVGIFEKIQKDFKLDDPRTALLELSKGKLTSDKKNHSGEGIYFTSRAFDSFSIRSGNLYYSREKRESDDWLIEVNQRSANRIGTRVEMNIDTDADWTITSIFHKYQSDNFKFRKTHVPIKLAQYSGEQLVSRSQAKRLLTRFDDFSEVFLDFKDIEHIGQGFADEIFRVFKNAHPKITLSIANANEDVLQMIKFVSVGEVTLWKDKDNRRK